MTEVQAPVAEIHGELKLLRIKLPPLGEAKTPAMCQEG